MTGIPLDDETRLAVREYPMVWFNAFAHVEDREKTLRRADPANGIQYELFRIYAWCQDNGVPCNIIGLKSRKEGLSTGATALAYHHLSEHTAEAICIGTDNETSDTLMKMVRRYAEHDAFDWGSNFRWKPAENRGVWTHGSEIKRDTAIDPKAGRSSTVQVLIATEVAHWPTDGKRSADETMLSILNSMPDIPNLLRVVDSTANGAGGFFYETYQGAVTFEQRKAGQKGNSWIKVFEPWFSNDLRVVPLDDRQRAEVRDTLTEREKRGMILFGWHESQVAWRRETIAAKCGNSELKFDQEYPESEEVAFQVSGSPRFDLVGCARLRKMAEINFPLGKIGTIEDNGSRIQFIRDANGYVWMIEPPTPGRSYCIVADVMTGEQSAGSKRRDCHAPGVLREGYLDADKCWHPAELVAAIHVEDEAEPGGCRWNLSLLADRIGRLSKMYGDCLVVPEANNPGIALIELLKERMVPVWQREDPDHLNLGKKLKKSGFRTDGKTKESVVEVMADVIQSAGIEGKEQFVCHYLRAAKEFATFVRNKDGTCSAAQGNFDDWCFVAGTLILTPDGEVPIERLRPGDFVTTRYGPRRVAGNSSRIAPVISNLGLVGTPNHPIITPDGERELSMLNDEDILYVWNSSKQTVEKRSFTEAKNTTDTPCRDTANCVSIFGGIPKWMHAHLRFIGKSGLTLTERFHVGLLFITKTATHSITAFGILRSCLEASMFDFMPLNQGDAGLVQKTASATLNSSSLDWQNGSQAWITEKCSDSISRRLGRHSSLLRGIFHVPAAGLFSDPISSVQNTAQRAAKFGSQIARLTQKRRVFNLRVEDSPEYFANGILVHNCMAIGIGLTVGAYTLFQVQRQPSSYRHRDSGAGVLTTQKGSGALG